MKPTSKLESVAEVKAPIAFPHVDKMEGPEVADKLLELAMGYWRNHLYSEGIALMARAAALLTAVPEGVTMIAVPDKHVEAMKATLTYLESEGS
jgi:hypothetical protein